MSAVTMGDPAEVVATTPVVGTAMMTAMVMMATIMAMMVMMRRDGVREKMDAGSSVSVAHIE